VIDLFSISYLRMDPHCEKQTKQRQDVVGTSKRGQTGKASVSRGPPPSHPSHDPSHSSDEEKNEHQLYERHALEECRDHYDIRSPRRPSKTLLTSPVKHLSMSAASSLQTLGFGLFSILTGTTLSTLIIKLQWC
jgi:hypothetical protein